MEFAVGSGSVRDLPPSKRFKYVGSSLGLVPCLPAKKRLCPQMPEMADVHVCLPAKKRGYALAAVAAEGGDFALCLPAKKRAYTPPVDDAVAPACLPAKKRAHAPPPADTGACPGVPARNVDTLPPPPAAAVEKAAISPSIPVPVRKRVHAPPAAAAAEKAAVSPSIPVPAKKRVNAPPPPPDTEASPRVPFKDVVNTLPPTRNNAVSPSIPANKSARAPPSPKDIAAPVSVCLPSNKRVMPPFPPPSPPLSKESDGPRVAAVKEAKPQGSNKRGGAITNPSVANGVEDYARAEASKPEKPINPEEIKEEVLKKPRPNTYKESKDQECKKSCKVICANQPEEVRVEALKKACKAIDLNEAAREEDSWDGEEVAGEPKQEAMAVVVAEEEVEEDDGVLCSVCASTDGDPSDPIVFCDGCDLMVHASCYGNPLAQSIPDGDWFCYVCAAKASHPRGAKKNKGNKPRCCLCPAWGGAMKRTTDARWAHIACALLVPEVFFRDPDGRDGVDCSLVPAHRFATECYVCESSRGCALECSQPKCGLGFHVSCGLDAGLCIEYQEAKAGGVVAGFCLEHTKLWEKQQLTGKYKIVSRGQK